MTSWTHARTTRKLTRGDANGSDRRAGTEVVAIPTTSAVTEEGARRILRRAGRTEEQIDAFIASSSEGGHVIDNTKYPECHDGGGCGDAVQRLL